VAVTALRRRGRHLGRIIEGEIMKALVLTASVISALCLSLPAVAQQQTPGKGAQAQTAPDPQAFDKQLQEAQAQMKRMQEQMDRIRQTKDPQERQRLMQEHWTTMQSAMTTMHGMWGPGMMGCCGAGPGMMGGPGMMHSAGMGGMGMGWGNMRQHYNRLTPEQLKQRQYMMDQYLGIQQMMMDHMMQRQQWMMQPPAAAPAK
jgi:hypothetical protein